MIDTDTNFQQFISAEHPLVSVVIPSFKKGSYLRECVTSFVEQDYPNLEILVVNDGSPDNTSELTKRLIAEFPNRKIELLEKPNGGVSDARNYGLSRTRGRIVMTMDGDDKVKPTYISTGVDTLRKSGGNLFFSNQENFGIEPGEWTPQQWDSYFIRYDNSVPTPAIYDRKLFEQTGGFKRCLGYAEDWEYWVSVSRFLPIVVRSDEHLTCYRTNDTGIAATYIDGRWQDCVSVVAMANEDLYSVDEVLSAHQHFPASDPVSLKRVRELASAHRNEWLGQFFMALLHESAGNIEESMGFYQNAIELSNYRNWQPIYRLARVLDTRTRVNEIVTLLHNTRTLRPDMRRFVDPRIKELTGVDQ